MNIEENQFTIAFEEAPFDSSMDERLQKLSNITKLWPSYRLSTRFKGFYEIFKKAKDKLPYYDFEQPTIEGYVGSVLGVKNPVLVQAYSTVLAYFLYCNLPAEINVADDCTDDFNCFTTFATKKEGNTFYEVREPFAKVQNWDPNEPGTGLPNNHNVKLVVRKDGALHELSEYNSEDGVLRWSLFIHVFMLSYKNHTQPTAAA